MTYAIYKFFGALSEPLNLFAVLLLIAAFLSLSSREGRQKLGRIMCLILALFLFFLAVTPLAQMTLSPLENRFASHYPPQVDGVMMLTGDENAALSEARGLPLSGYAAQRHLFLARMVKRYPKAKLVAVGNPTPFFKSKKTSIRSLLEDDFKVIGLPVGRIQFEERSRTTRENALFTKELVKPKKGEKWLLLTSASHMPRAVLSFEAVGWKVLPFPTDYFTYPKTPKTSNFSLTYQCRLFSRAVHEYVGLLVYRLLGWTERLWP